MKDLIEKTSEMMIDEDFILSEIQKWTMETRHAIEEPVNWTKRGKSVIGTYHKQKADEIQSKMIEHERRKREEDSKEAQMHEENSTLQNWKEKEQHGENTGDSFGDKKEIIGNGKEDEKSKCKVSQAGNYCFSRHKQGLDSICQSVPCTGG